MDVALALDIVSGPTPGDLRSLDVPTLPFRPALDDPTAPVRVLWAPSIEGMEPDAEILAVCRSAVDRIAAAGVEVVETGPVLSDVIGPFLLLFYGNMVPAYREAMADPERFALVTPQLQDILTFAAELLTPDAIEVARQQAQALSLTLADQMQGFDVLLSPTVAGQTPVSEQHGTINGEQTESWVSYTFAFNVTRRPAGTTNAGFTADGMPVGLQIVGQQLDDLRTLEVTAWIEDLLGLDPVAPIG